MVGPVGTRRNLHTTEAALASAGLTSIIQELPSLIGKNPQTFKRYFATEKMANRAMRLMYQWLYFHPQIKMGLSLRVEGTVLSITVKSTVERRGRRGRKI